MAKLLDTIASFLIDEEWKFDVVKDRGIIKTGVRSKSGAYGMFFECREDQSIVAVYFLGADRVAEDKRHAVAEFITRANYGLRLGNFELDFADGEVRFKMSVALADGVLTGEMIKTMVGVGVATLDKYYPGVESVAGGQVPQDVIRKIETAPR